MRHSDLIKMANHVFGPHLAVTYMNETVLDDLGYCTVNDAIKRGIPVKVAWIALCDFYEIPEGDRWEIPAARTRGR